MSIESGHPTSQHGAEKNDVEMLEHASPQNDRKETFDEHGVHDHVTRTPEEAKLERRLLLKADLIILPLIFIAYLLDFLDRSDVGNAAVAGMTEDLHMSAQQLSTAASMFYVTYIVFQLPGNLALRIVDPQIQLALALMVWGLFNALLGTAKNYATVLGLRLGVGFGEAFFQAAPIYISLWYKRNEYSWRAAITFCASPTAGAVNGLIAYAIETNLGGKDGLASWRWLFIIEGVISIGWAFVILACLPPAPEKARLLFSAADRDLAIRRTREAFNEPHSKIRWAVVLEAFRDCHFYLFAIIFSCANISLASFSTFLPVILRELGYSKLNAQLLTIPVYVVAALSVLTTAFFSDRIRRRGYFMIGIFALLVTGWLLLLVSKNRRLSFAATFLIGAGTYPSIVLTFSWTLNNYAGFTRRAGTYAMVSMVAQCFSISATQIYSDPPTYSRGNGFALGSAVLGFCTCIVLVFRLKRVNRRKKNAAGSDAANRLRLLSVEELGNEHPDFYHFI